MVNQQYLIDNVRPPYNDFRLTNEEYIIFLRLRRLCISGYMKNVKHKSKTFWDSILIDPNGHKHLLSLLLKKAVKWSEKGTLIYNN